MKQKSLRSNALVRALGAGLVLSVVSFAAQAGTLTVSAAASLTNVFNDVAAAYKKAHPDTTIQYNFAASGALLQQIRQGAPVDVFASADQKTMNDAAKAGLLDEATRKNFVRNEVVLITPSSSNGEVKDLQSLKSPAVSKIAVGSVASVPVGRYTEEGLEKSGQWEKLTPKFIFAENVRQVLDYVSRGEVQAGFVYATDAAVRSDKVRVVQSLPIDTVVSYPVAVIKTSPNAAEARSFVEFLDSDQAQEIFSKAGFRKP
ncbi:molybdate ABC transporter substrate-binding protein [Advenella mimigardefordensis]|uniref:Molybdate ABC transporter, periplasmic molybdate-binding protein n=1 Tax=Advenella mimigardefordensis (strain DSM 17166 / LMG 22922 / DPN7) TaxID=1247726 RepID=W0PCX7_ADVMD|nr:molybdate ABC transporter substrate-binding protein [Advenella mimigardefordensis]AHG63255.1 molybdate ABC transporter, periplasmic molybdate-binding protein [Advenella mimigardefordensis DPN7]